MVYLYKIRDKLVGNFVEGRLRVFSSLTGKKKQFKGFEEPHNSSGLKRQIERATPKRTLRLQGGSPCRAAAAAARPRVPPGTAAWGRADSGQKVPGTASDRSRKNLLPPPRLGWRRPSGRRSARSRHTHRAPRASPRRRAY